VRQLKEMDEMETVVKGGNVISLLSPVSVIRVRKGQRWEAINLLLIEEFGTQYTKEISMLMGLVATALRYGRKGSQVSLANDAYTAANKLTHQGLSRKKTSALLELMDEAGYIEMYVGYYDPERECGVPSFFLITQKLLTLWEGVDISTAPKKEEPDIIVRDSLTKESLSTRPFRGITMLRADLNAYNKLIASATVSVGGEVLCAEYKRIFHDSLEGGGRYYTTNGVQTMPKGNRQEIKINGYSTVELDFSAMHPRLLYSLEHVQLHPDFCPYKIQGVSREEAKLSILFLLYSKSREAARSLLVHEKICPSLQQAEEVIRAVEKHNKALSKYFCKEALWKALQHLDSNIASFVLTSLTKKGIVALPWHDSFVVEEHNEPILRGLMFEGWKREAGYTMNCVVTRKP